MTAYKSLLYLIIEAGVFALYIPLALLRSGPRIEIGPFSFFAIPLWLIGSWIVLQCFWDFTFKGRGTPMPVDPPKELVFLLWIAAIFGVIAVLPYLLSLQSNLLQNLKLLIPLPWIITLQVVQNAILFAIAIFGGLFFAGRVGLGTPMLESVTRGESVTDRVSAILGASSARLQMANQPVFWIANIWLMCYSGFPIFQPCHCSFH